MSSTFFFMMGLTLFFGFSVIACMLLSRTTQTFTERILAASMRKRQVKKERQLSQRLQGQVFSSVHWLRSRIGLSDDPKLLERFAQSGFNTKSHRDLYTTSRMVLPILGLIAGSFAPSNSFFWMVALAGISYLGPDMILQRTVKARREQIRQGIPDAIDLLVICVDAGLGMDQAILRVGQELETSHPKIYEEFLQISREQRAGKLRLEAWQAMATRCKLPEIDAFVNMLMQTERFGTPIARALSNFGDGIRQRRRQQAEEKAAKTTVKIIFPLVLCIFPSLFIVLLGPACLTIAQGLSGITP